MSSKSPLHSIAWDKVINSPRWPWALWLGAFLIYVIVAVSVTGLQTYEPSGDEGEYFELAKNLAETGQFVGKGRQLFRTPIYPGLLAMLFIVTGPEVAVAKLFNCFIGAFIPLGLFYLGKLLFNRRIGAAAGIVSLIQPTILGPIVTLYSESLSSAAFVWVNVFIVYQAQKVASKPPGSVKDCWPAWLGLGAALGLLVLIKPQHVFFLPFLLMGGIWHFWQLKLRLVPIISLILLSFCLIMSPWWIRNARLSNGYFIPLTTSGDRTFIDANNPTIAHMIPHFEKIGDTGRKIWLGPGKHLHDLRDNELVDPDVLRQMNEVEQARYFRHQALAWILAQPRDWLILVIKKLGYGFSVWPIWQGSVTLFICSVFFLIILALSLPGWITIMKNPGLPRLLLLHLLTYLAVTILFFGSWRYRHPYEGSFILAAVLGVSELRKIWPVLGVNLAAIPSRSR